MQERSTVLVVDDEESVRGVLQRTLKEAGFSAFVAANGAEALRWMSQGTFEVMLLDIKMPGMSGMEVLEKVRADYPDTGVILVTAVSDVQTAVDAMKAGAYDYILKPFNLDDVVLRVQRARERRLLVLQNREYQDRLEEKVRDQAERLQEQFTQLIQALSREHKMALDLEELRGAKRGQSLFSRLPPEMREAKASVQEFIEALTRVVQTRSLGKN